MTPRRQRVLARAPGTIPLSVIIGQKDDRGHHAVTRVLHAVGPDTTVTVEPALTTTVTTDPGVPDEATANAGRSALATVAMLREHTGRREDVALHLQTPIPIAGGTGATAAAAAATLVALNGLWDLGLAPEQLRKLGSRLEARVACALLGHSTLVQDEGEDASSLLATGDWHWVLAVPDGPAQGPAVYRRHDRIVAECGRDLTARVPADPSQFQALRGGDVALLGETLRNDLQAACFAEDPRLIGIVEAAEQAGAYGAIVCGCGPTIAALAGDRSHAEEIAARLPRTDLVRSVLIVAGNVPGARVLEEE